MDWYYAVGEERKGPHGDEEFQRLVQQGVVTPQTLVWREGLSAWQTYESLAGTVDMVGAPPPVRSAAAPAAPSGVVCSGCHGVFSSGDVISLGGGFYCASCKPLAVQRMKEGATASGEADRIRNEHLKHEASVKSVGLLYYLGGAVMLVLGLVSFLAVGRSQASGTTAGAVLTGLLLAALGAGQIVVGSGLRGLRKWARIPTGILSGFGLLGFPLGTVINAYILYLVFGEKGKMVFSEEYRLVVEQTPHIKYRTSVVVWVLLALLIGLLGIAMVSVFLGGRR